MIKVLSGFTGPGGSTVAFNTLVNLFNKNGLDACLYGHYKWEGINCKFEYLDNLKVSKDDHVIYHFMVLPKLDCKAQILSCHETEIFKIKEIKNLSYSKLHFVSEFQKNWQEIGEGVVIPNPVRKFHKAVKVHKIAGILGSVDKNKRTDLSIKKALEDNHTDIRVYGPITDFPFYKENVEPLLSDIVTYRGISTDMTKTYSLLSHVYHSPKLETYNLIKPECESAGVIYIGGEACQNQAEYWDDERILEAWKKLLLS